MNALIVGTGAIGSWLAYNLASDTMADLTILDFDKVEKRNIQAKTQFYLEQQIGKRKVDALQYNIYTWAGKTIKVINSRIEVKGIPELLKLVFKIDLIADCFDNYQSRKLITTIAKQQNIPCVHIGFSPLMTFAIEWNETYIPPNIQVTWDICQAEGAASFIRMVAGHASIIVQEFMKTNRKISMTGNRFTNRLIE